MATVLEIRDKESRSEYPLETYGKGSSWRYTSRRSFLVNTSSAEAAKVDAGIPQYGAAHPNDSTLYVTSISARSHESSADWMRVDVDYGRLGATGETPEEIEPLDWSWTSVSHSERIYWSRNGNPLCNKGGELYDVEVPRADVRLHVAFSVAAYNGSMFWDYVNHINSNTIDTGGCYAPAGTALVETISAESRTRNALDYYRITMDVLFRTQIYNGTEYGWKLVKPVMGYYTVTGGDRKQIMDANGLPVATPSRLSNDCTRVLGPDELTVYQVFDIYPETDFAGINLGDTKWD